MSKRQGVSMRTDQIPTGRIDAVQLVLVNNRPHHWWSVSDWSSFEGAELKVERDIVSGMVPQIVERPSVREQELEEILTRQERKDGVKRLDVASARAEEEAVGPIRQ